LLDSAKGGGEEGGSIELGKLAFAGIGSIGLCFLFAGRHFAIDRLSPIRIVITRSLAGSS
jgi:hypothetical protein